MYSATLKKVEDDNGKKVYQCQELKQFCDAEQYYTRHCEEFCRDVSDCLRSRMEWSDHQVMRDIISVLATQGWEKIVEEHDSLECIDQLITRFTVPLQGAQADCSKIKEEFQSLLQYAVHFISLSTLDYRAVWWRLFNAPSSSEWSNVLILILVELLFSLPASNGKLERVFSQLNVIKTNKRTSLTNESLDDLLLLTTENLPLSEFSPDSAIDLWWRDKVRRPNQRKRKVYKKHSHNLTTESGDSTSTEPGTESENDSDSQTDLLTEWDEWISTS